MTQTGPQRYPGASTAHWYQTRYGGQAMESNVIVWHTTEGTSLPGYDGGSTAPNFTAVPDFTARTLRWHQHFDFDTSSRALVNRASGVETNTLNACQVEIVGTCDPAAHLRWGSTRHLYTPALPDWAIRDLAAFTRWAHDHHGVPLTSGVTFKAYPASYGRNGVRMAPAAWSGFSGHCGHQHVPENDHGDPGALPMTAILTAARRGTESPEQETDDDMPKYVNLGLDEPYTIRPGQDWDAIEFTTEWTDETGDHAAGGSVFVRGPARFTGQLSLALRGVPIGGQAQVRLSEVDGDGHLRADHPIAEAVGTEGSTYVAIPFTGRVGTGRGMRVRVKGFQSTPITVTSAVLKALVWKED